MRFEYLARLDENNQLIDYYKGITSFDFTYLLSKGKKAVLDSNDMYKVEIPKNIKKVSVIAIDYTGNWSKIDSFEII
ncbi:hypothetical protein D3C73_1436590 [compost metagenome]